ESRAPPRQRGVPALTGFAEGQRSLRTDSVPRRKFHPFHESVNTARIPLLCAPRMSKQQNSQERGKEEKQREGILGPKPGARQRSDAAAEDDRRAATAAAAEFTGRSDDRTQRWVRRPSARRAR